MKEWMTRGIVQDVAAGHIRITPQEREEIISELLSGQAAIAKKNQALKNVAMVGCRSCSDSMSASKLNSEQHNSQCYIEQALDVGSDISALKAHDAEVRKPMVEALKRAKGCIIIKAYFKAIEHIDAALA